MFKAKKNMTFVRSVTVILTICIFVIFFHTSQLIAKPFVEINPYRSKAEALDDKRHFTIAKFLAYTYFDNPEFRQCAAHWLDGSNEEVCDVFQLQIFGIATSFHIDDLSSISDQKFIEIIEAYMNVIKPFWGSGIKPDSEQSKPIIKQMMQSIDNLSRKN